MLDLTHEESSPSILRAYVESGRWTDQTVSAEFPLTIITLIAEEALRLQVPSHEIVIRITGVQSRESSNSAAWPALTMKAPLPI